MVDDAMIFRAMSQAGKYGTLIYIQKMGRDRLDRAAAPAAGKTSSAQGKRGKQYRIGSTGCHRG
jgi:hypothetical protein